MHQQMEFTKQSKCLTTIATGMSRLIEDAVKEGYDVKEVALVLADLAEDFVMDLADKSRKSSSARSN